MDVIDLTREQLTELKERYLMRLSDEGSFSDVIGVDYDEPSCADLANADEIVPDEVIFREYEDTWFEPDDFFCTSN